MDNIYNKYFFEKHLDDLLKVYNYIDGIIVTNKKGIIQYYKTFRPDLNSIKDKEVIGKHILEVYPGLSEETSTILRVLKNGEHIYDEYQEVTSFEGKRRFVIESTIPIRFNDEIVGAVNLSRYAVPDKKMQDIILFSEGMNDLTPVSNEKNNTICSLDDFITSSEKVIKMKEKVLRIANTGSNVLICGETGTGKDIIAQSIHYHSDRRAFPYVYQNCSAIPEQLLESILFGTVKGAYTGSTDRKGLFEIAQNGTLFLDEINSMNIGLQPKILTAIEKKQIRKIGGTDNIDINVRIIAAMNEEPSKAIKDGKLRRDLFFRLSTIMIDVPPLRDRKEDVITLAEFFIRQFNEKFGKEVLGLSEKLRQIFLSYDWPGNVRELKNIIEGGIALSDEHRYLTETEIPDYITNKEECGFTNTCILNESIKNTTTLKEKLYNYEKEIILSEIKNTENLSEAAKNLGISRQALYYKIKKIENDLLL